MMALKRAASAPAGREETRVALRNSRRDTLSKRATLALPSSMSHLASPGTSSRYR